MAKLTLFLFTAGLCATVFASSGPVQSLEDELDKLKRNAEFENRQAKVEVEMVVFTLQKEALEGVKDAEKKECIKKVKTQALSESEDMLAKTVGTLPAAVAEAKAASADKDPAEVLAKLDYKNLKKSAINQLTELLDGWPSQLEKKFAACLQ